jgi:hypothetical protein
VRCGVCNDCFNALDTLSEELAAPSPPPTVEESVEAVIPPPTAEQPVVAAMTAEEASGALEEADTSGGLADSGLDGTEEPSLAPVHAEETLPDLGVIAAEPRAMPDTVDARPPLWRTSLWAAANVLLILVLLGQYGYYNRQQLAQYPALRPWVAQLCATTGCALPLQRDVRRIALTSRLVESHPSRPNALLIDATLVNQADFAQPYPLVELRFSDLNNQLVAGRRFRPEEYLPPTASLQTGMAPHQPVHITLEITDPGKDAVSFQFELL